MTNKPNTFGKMLLSNALKLGVTCIAAGTVVACSTEGAPGPLEPTGPTGRVRLVNVITDATRGRVNASLEGLVFTVDLQYTQAAPANVPAPATTAYAAVYAGDRTFVLKRTADTTVTVATLPFTIAEGQDRTVYAIGGAGGSAITSVVTTDDNSVVVAGETRVRVVNMSPTAGAVDVFITAIGADLATATPRVTNLAYQAPSAYFSVAAGAYQIRGVPAGTAPANRTASVIISLASNAPAPLTPPAFSSGTGRTVVLADNNIGGSPLRAFVITDR